MFTAVLFSTKIVHRVTEKAKPQIIVRIWNRDGMETSGQCCHGSHGKGAVK